MHRHTCWPECQQMNWGPSLHIWLINILLLLYYRYLCIYVFMFIKVNGYTSKGNNSTISKVTSHLSGNLLLKARICSPGSKFCPTRVNSFWNGFTAQGSKQEVTKGISLHENGGRNMELYSFTLPFSFCTHNPHVFNPHVFDEIVFLNLNKLGIP